MPYVIRQARILIVTLVAAMSILSGSACSPTHVDASHNAGTGDTMNSQKVASSSTPGTTPPQTVHRPWTAIRNWVYWLDTPDIKQISATNFELAVIDYSGDGSAARAFSAKQVEMLRTSGCQRRVVAYLSIGQAEAYRGYWQRNWHPGSPSWLGTPDPNWESNYWVNYWDPEWQNVIYRYLDAIIAAGFDGIYLDRIDAYEEAYATGHEDDMVRFVTNIAHYARAHSPLGEDFGIIVQNAEELAAHHPDYVQMVTGIGREEVYVQATNRPTSQPARANVEHNLDLFRQNSRGKLVLTVDYADQAKLVQDAYERARARGYIPYVAGVGLGALQINPGYEPVCHPLT
ncbi:MAG TPA: MJ1477/TM1410 family putative glycoside hydrolase [Ktedonosporobacter sp.]|nr:MJ1477/TM1410 family putative glycoside hydrolase [Ktedonosporobacter sp.]